MARMSEQPGLTVPVVWSEDCLRHEPGGEVWLGVRDQGTEVPARALVMRDALAAAGAPIVPARSHGDEILRAVHDGGLLDHLAGVWAAWEHEGYPAQYGRDRVVPYVFPTPGMLGGLAPRTGDEGWLAAVSALCADAAAHRPDAVVMSLGLDAAESDPESPLRVSGDGYRRAAREIAALGPTVVIQEGGYDLAALGSLAG